MRGSFWSLISVAPSPGWQWLPRWWATRLRRAWGSAAASPRGSFAVGRTGRRRSGSPPGSPPPSSRCCRRRDASLYGEEKVGNGVVQQRRSGALHSSFIYCTLTNITTLAVLITWQASVSRVVASYHSSIVVDDCIQVIDGGVLHLVLLANTELTQIQIPAGQNNIRGCKFYILLTVQCRK